MAATPLSFDSFSLQSSSVVFSAFEDGDAPERQLDIYNLLGGGGAVISDDTYYRKVIPSQGVIQGSSVSNLETLIDTFQAAMAKRNKNLDVGYAGGTRRYVATPSKVAIKRGRRAQVWAEVEV